MALSWLILAFTSFLSFANLDEPDELMTINRHGLCPEASLPTSIFDADSSRPADLSHDAARAALALYALPDMENVISGAELIIKSYEFIGMIPEGYRFHSFFFEPDSGMKYMLLRPRLETDKRPDILAIAGTRSLLRWLGDPPPDHLAALLTSRLVRLFTTCQFLDVFSTPFAARRLIITGHSVGGGLAETFAYLIQSKRLELGLSPMAIDLITFNSFGGRALIEKIIPYDESVTSHLRAHNYFVEGDVLSTVGDHVGPQFSLGAPPDTTSNPPMVDLIHSLSTVLHLGPRALENAKLATPGFTRSLATISRYPSLFSTIPDWLYLHSRDRILELLNEAALTLERTDLTEESNREVVRYLIRLLLAKELSLRDSPVADNEMVRDLRGIRTRLHRGVP